jgi:hypothetical protein
MNQYDERYVQMQAMAAAVSAAAYAQKKARDEARRALLLSNAVNQNMSNLDPNTKDQLRQLLAAETRRVRQENWDWKAAWSFIGLIAGGFGLLVLLSGLFAVLSQVPGFHSSYSYDNSYQAPVRPLDIPDIQGWHGKRVSSYGQTGEVIARDDKHTRIKWPGLPEPEDYTNDELQTDIARGQIIPR